MPSRTRKQMSCRKQTSGSISECGSGLPPLVMAGAGRPDHLLALFFSVYEKDSDLVVQEIATRPLTQDLLQHEVKGIRPYGDQRVLSFYFQLSTCFLRYLVS